MKKLKLLYLFLSLPVILFSQSREISGTILVENNEPLPGASIIVKNTSIGASSDFDGNFSLSIPGDAKILIVSFLGYKTKEVNLTNETNYIIQLETDRNSLEEVVVIGYGSAQRKDLTGSITKVKENSEISSQYASVGSLLQGRTSGVQVSSNMGTPGAPVSIRIRGTNSLRGNNEPLYVIDGVIINSAGEDVLNATSDANERQQTQNGLTGLNPRDIESIEILKDASATAIYGSRGANGVVLITTKKGKQGNAVINVFSSTTISQVNNKIDVLDAVNFAQYKNQAAIILGNNIPYQIENGNVHLISNGIPDTLPLRQINWQDEIYKIGYSKNFGVDMSGATEKSNYYLSANINELEGAVPNTFLNSANFRVNYSNNLSKKLKLDTRVGIYFGRGNMSQGATSSGGQRSFTRQLISYNPIVDGELDDDDIGVTNPFSWISDYEEKIKEKRVNVSVNLTYQVAKGLKYQLRAGGNYRDKFRSRWYGTGTFKGGLTNGNLALSTLEKTAYTLDNLLMYNKSFNSENRLSATVGVSYDGSDATNTIYELGQFPISNLREKSPQLGELVITPFTSLGVKDAILSYLGRVTYTYKDKYIFNGTFRADKSSKFQGDNKQGYFPSASFAWIASKENFLSDSKVVNNLKLRASWGQVGNQGINPYQTFSNYGAVLYSDANNSTVLGVAALNIANKDLTWETTTQLNFGADINLYDNRITSSIDIYKKETSDLLINLPTPTSTGFRNFLVNQGGIENNGIDISIDALVVEKENLTFSLGGNISFNKSKVVSLDGLPKGDIMIDGKLVNTAFYLGNGVSTGNNFKSPANAFIEGQPIGVFWGYKTNGIYNNADSASAGPTFQGNPNLPGDVVFLDQNGDGNINDADKTIIGDPNPDFTFGINSNISYKDFNLSMLFTGSKGNQILNGNLLVENNAIGSGGNIRPEAYLDSWTVENPNGAFPRIGSTTANDVPNDRLIEDGSYIRLNNVTLSYDLDLKKKSFINKLKLYVSGNNLFTITDYSGYDPELTSFLYDGTIIGVDWLGTPNVSSFVLGVNINF